MTELVIYGASDDLIEIESTSFEHEEFSISCDETNILAISDGTLLRVRYDEDGVWRFSPVVLGSSTLDIKQGIDDQEHSDRVTLVGDNLKWVVLGTQIAK